jgi:3-deoxy-manno-octulosonate cytidylyltransferase (CMP-KDO synthetase)
MLANICGKPVLRHVLEAAASVVGIEEVVVLTEAEIVQKAVASWGGTCWMTSKSCGSGTERIASVVGKLCGDYIFNVQGDEPFLDVNLVEQMVKRTVALCDFDILTPVFQLPEDNMLISPNIVKVVRGHDGRALYFSRCPIPYVRDCKPEQWANQKIHMGHIGIYLYRRELLENFINLPQSRLASAESLEQLRFLQAGYCIQTIEAKHFSPAIDVPDDLQIATEFYNKHYAKFSN